MKIGFIARGLTPGGVRRFTKNILSEFNQRGDHEIHLFTDEEGFAKKYSNLRVHHLSLSNKLFWDYIKLPFELRKHNLDVVFYPKNIIPLTHVFLKPNKINIIHDLAYFVPGLGAYPFWDTLYMKTFMKLSCYIADVTVAVSKNTRRDLGAILGVNKSQVRVVYEAVENKFKKGVSSEQIRQTKVKYNLGEPFIFYSGSISPRKNLLRALKAFDKIKEQVPHQFYISTTKFWGGENQKIRKLVNNQLADRVKVLPFLPEDELIVMYSLADLYVYVSLYEGFGLPILEAQACGCPVLTSNVSSMPEVAGKGAYLVDPTSEDVIGEAILRILTNNQVRQGLVEKGFQNIKRFDWTQTSQELLELVAHE